MNLVSIIPTCYIKQCLLLQVADFETAHRTGFLLVCLNDMKIHNTWLFSHNKTYTHQKYVFFSKQQTFLICAQVDLVGGENIHLCSALPSTVILATYTPSLSVCKKSHIAKRLIYNS